MMNKSEMILRRQELVNMMEHRSSLENKTRFEDYPELNDELIKIDAELYPELDACDYCGREIPEGDFCRHCFDDEYTKYNVL